MIKKIVRRILIPLIGLSMLLSCGGIGLGLYQIEPAATVLWVVGNLLLVASMVLGMIVRPFDRRTEEPHESD